MTKNKKKNIKNVEIEEVIEEIEEFDDEEFEVDIEDENEDFTYEELTMEDRIIGIEKKVNTMFVLTIIIAVISLITLLTNFNTTSPTTTEETHGSETSGSYSTDGFVKAAAQDLESLSKGKTIVVWIGRQGCGYCTQYVPTITSVGTKLGIDIHYLDLADVFDFTTNPVSLKDQKAYELLENFATDEENKDVMQELGATPMTLVIKNNKIVGSFTGALPEDQVLSTLKAEGFKEK
jgi:predicted bacteriocin transport accessory protein